MKYSETFKIILDCILIVKLVIFVANLPFATLEAMQKAHESSKVGTLMIEHSKIREDEFDLVSYKALAATMNQYILSMSLSSDVLVLNYYNV